MRGSAVVDYTKPTHASHIYIHASFTMSISRQPTFRSEASLSAKAKFRRFVRDPKMWFRITGLGFSLTSVTLNILELIGGI